MPRLSVLIPAHNAAQTLPRAVASVAFGLPRDSEIVIANDGSSDATGEIAEKLAQQYPNLRVVHNARAQGVAGALNTLLQSSDSEMVARMDADDVSLPGRIPLQLRALKQADAVFTPMVTYGSKLSQWRPQRRTPLSNDVIEVLLTLTNPLGHPTLLTKRHWLDKVNGYRNVPAEDYDLWLRMSLAGAQLVRIGIPGYAYQQHSAQITASSSWRTASWENPQTGATFEQFTEHVLGKEMKRLTAAAISPWANAAAFESYLAEFTELVHIKIHGLPKRYHRYVLSILARRIGHAENVYCQLN